MANATVVNTAVDAVTLETARETIALGVQMIGAGAVSEWQGAELVVRGLVAGEYTFAGYNEVMKGIITARVNRMVVEAKMCKTVVDKAKATDAARKWAARKIADAARWLELKLPTKPKSTAAAATRKAQQRAANPKATSKATSKVTSKATPKVDQVINMANWKQETKRLIRFAQEQSAKVIPEGQRVQLVALVEVFMRQIDQIK